MGRWTLDHHDDVLRRKLKTLVTGACKRAQLEKGEPSITYETFVEELDEGDSFTTSLIDILVKEMAERRMRSNPNDRRLISERTAKNLRSQAGPLHIYRGRSTTARQSHRRFPISEYLSIPPEELELSGSEYDWGFGESNNNVEGVRLPTELYDALVPMSHALDGGLDGFGDPRPPASASNPGRQDITSPRPQSPTLLDPPSRSLPNLSSPGSGDAGLSAGRPARRPSRTRAIDFNDFTLRRRASIRHSSTSQSATVDHHNAGTIADDPTWHFSLPGSNSGSGGNRSLEDSSASNARATSRRFFGSLSAHRRHEIGSGEPWSSEPRDPAPGAALGSLPSLPPRPISEILGTQSSGQSSAALWYSLTNHGLNSSSTSGNTNTSNNRATGARSAGEENEERERERERERPLPGRTLRRGGLRAPESLLSRYASPSLERGAATLPSPLSSTSSSTGSSRPPSYSTIDVRDTENSTSTRIPIIRPLTSSESELERGRRAHVIRDDGPDDEDVAVNFTGSEDQDEVHDDGFRSEWILPGLRAMLTPRSISPVSR